MFGEEIDLSVILQSMSQSKKLIDELKPYLFDLLKRNKNFRIIDELINNLVEDTDKYEYVRQFLETYLCQRDILCSLIDSCSKISLPRLGSLIARNDYPIPLSFYKLSTDNHLEYQLNFEILYEVLSLTNRKLIVINELNSNNMLNLKEILFPGSACFATKFDFPRWDYVDVMLNEDCVIAHFNFWVNECKKVNRDLMNSFSAFSSLHIVSTTLSDYTSLEPCQELKDLFKLSSNLKNKTFFLIILRLDGEKFREINSIKSRLKELYVPELVELIEYETEFNSNEINYGEIDYGEKEKLNAIN